MSFIFGIIGGLVALAFFGAIFVGCVFAFFAAIFGRSE